LNPLDADLVRQVNWAIGKNVEFCNSGEPLTALEQIQGLRQDFKNHLSWMTKLSNLGDVFSKFAVPNYLVRVLNPLSQSIRLDFLTGRIPECLLGVRALLEQLARAFQADLRFPKEKLFSSKLSRVDAQESMLMNLVEHLDGQAADFLTELDNGWVDTDQPLTGLGNALATSAGPAPYTSQDLPKVVQLTDSVKKFRELLSRTMEKWKANLDK
jgi:hypothetical protein